MKLHKIAILLLVYMMSTQVGQAYAADDWVDDDQVNGFYKKGIIRSRDDYETPPQDMRPGDIEDGSVQQQEPDDGGMNQSFNNPMQPQGNFSNQGPPAGNPQFTQPPPNKSFFGKAKSLGKSIVTFPNKALMGDDGFFDNPGFWQGAGAVAGMGANSYLNYKMNRNNPYYGGGYGLPYGGGYNPYGYNGMGIPYSPYSSINPYGFGGGIGNPNYGNPYGSNPLLPFGLPGQTPNFNSVNPAVPYSPYGLGNYGLGNYGYGNPGFGGGIYGRPGLFGNGLGGYGNGLGGFGNGLGGFGNGLGGFGNGGFGGFSRFGGLQGGSVMPLK
jgi:hypothetical protein